ncbi:hypothetical protein BC939DRAFT_472175 [Gamsiella multidivaricata]|uniref:uncharacterized protein n=1 Tax=Gamsiella multidivaricata TaxID=101098 RepID=UPI002220381C|nr:uncharacterized protein BC939DRAFT_472175 [Gamsiella multidivaricata]KAI7832562.1 hypothetical protein BC939DRAFT_472175 [Gamsiella multidivaricata]
MDVVFLEVLVVALIPNPCWYNKRRVVALERMGPPRGAYFPPHTLSTETFIFATSHINRPLIIARAKASIRGQIALTNFRMLVHSDHSCAQQMRSDALLYHKSLRSEHRIPSSIIPPLPALQQLYAYLESSNHVDQLTAADWNSFIFWLSHHEDYRTLSVVHRAMLSDIELGSKCSTPTYIRLAEGRVRLMSSEPHAGTTSERLGLEATSHGVSSSISDTTLQSSSGVVQTTIDWMESLDIPRSMDLYELWLKSAFQERSWRKGIEAWDRMIAEGKQLFIPSITMMAYALQCHLHSGNMSKAGNLLESILERSAAIQQRQNDNKVVEGSISASIGRGSGEGELEVGAVDERSEFPKRQKKSLRAPTALQHTSEATMKSNSANTDSSSAGYLQEWKMTFNPALIEAICLGDKDKDGVTLATELALELFKEGHLLDKTRFRFLTRYIAECRSSEDAEAFLRRLVELTKSASLAAPLTAPTNNEQDSAATSSSPKGSRRTKKTIDSTSRILAEVGLQEIVKQASTERDFDRARKISQGMASQGIPLGAEASERLIVGLARSHDVRSALTVLEQSLQDKWIPSIETANILMRGLIRDNMLDESVAVFRDLTENHGLKPDVEMYRNLMSLASSYGQLTMTQRILSTLRGLGVRRDGEQYEDLMRCYVRTENLQGAIKIFETMDRAGVKTEIRHINVLLEGAVRRTSPATVVGILEIMSSQRVHPNAETWNILLSGAFRARDVLLAQELYHELTHSVVEGAMDKADGSLRASRHPETFRLLVNEYADRHGVEPALKLLKGALDAAYPSRVAPSMYRELIEKSCKQRQGVAGYEFYQLLRRCNLNDNGTPPELDNHGDKSGSGLSYARGATMSSTSVPAITSSSPSVMAPSLAKLCRQLMTQLDRENQLELGKEMATDLILTGFDMDEDLVAAAIRAYARSDELAAAFGLFTKMGRVYNVEPSAEMVLVLMEASKAHGLSPTSVLTPTAAPTANLRASSRATAASSVKWDEGSTQQWMKALRVSMEKFGILDDTI